MKELLAVILLVSAAVGESPAPYAPSGWRPSGPSFELPQKTQGQPQNQHYLPPVDPRNQLPSSDGDVSVQGLPQPEPRPQFQASPVSGQEYTGPSIQQDLRSLDKSFQQFQYQQQQERYREYQRQRQLEAQDPKPNPRQFSRTTEAPTTQTATTSIELNQGESLNEPKEKTTVEVTKQKVQEYPGELFLSSLAQLQLQPQFVPLQSVSSQYVQPSEQKTGFDGPAHFSALPSVLAQQAQKLQANQQPILVQQPFSQFAQAQVQTYQPQEVSQYPDSVVLQAPAQFQPNVYLQPNPDSVTVQSSQYTPVQPVPQYQPVQPQFMAQPVAFQPKPERNPEQVEKQSEPIQANQNQQQNQFYQQPIVVQPFPAQVNQYQPQNQYTQPGQEPQFLQPAQPQSQFLQPGQPQPQFQQQAPQNQYAPAPQNVQPQFAQPEVQYLQPQYSEPQSQYGQPLTQDQFQPQPQNQYIQPQFAQPQVQPLVDPQNQYLQPQFAQQHFGQPQQQFSQPQQQFAQPQQQFAQPQQQYAQPQQQFGQPQFQGQDNLQSGLDINQEGNDIDEPEETEDEGATAVATAFGSRTQPRVNTRYGAPYPVPKVQANPGTTTESAVEDITEEGPAVAQAVAVANGERRKSARLRSRRIRPVYAVDRSGRLVLAEV